METFLSVSGAVLFILVCVGAVVSISLTLPGTLLLVLATAFYGFVTGFSEITYTVLAGQVGLMAVAEGGEYLIGIWGAKKYGSSNKAVVGSLIGGFVGGILGSLVLPVIGSILGVFAGAFVGAFVVEWWTLKDLRIATNVGWGALIGRIIGTVMKVSIGFVMVIVNIVALF